jgi:hypothetical protein
VRTRSTAAILLAGTLLAGCSDGPPQNTPTPAVVAVQADRDRLAGLAATALDRRYVATYTLATPKRASRTVTVAVATDGSWVVAVPGSGLGGLADLAMYGTRTGLFQCALGPALGAAGSRPDLPPVTPGCAKVSRLTKATDPRVQHVFTDWIGPLVDRATALSVTAAPLLAGASGECFSVESNSAALAPPVDPGIYCYTPDGTLTAARLGFGTLTLASPVGAAPPSVAGPDGRSGRPADGRATSAAEPHRDPNPHTSPVQGKLTACGVSEGPGPGSGGRHTGWSRAGGSPAGYTRRAGRSASSP